MPIDYLKYRRKRRPDVNRSAHDLLRVFRFTSSESESKDLVARNDPVDRVPPVRNVDRAGIDVPAVAVSAPARAHGPEVSILTLEVEDEPLLALAVGREERLELEDREFGLVAELCENGGVE